jgi:glycosyltransferase involved in cell wall biosynthesis
MWFNCVSASQRATCPPDLPIVDTIENGVAMPASPEPARRRGYAVALGRICPEKGFEVAFDAARLADVPLLLGGAVFGYPAHGDYFARVIRPRLDRRRRFLGPLGPRAKRRLLAGARCLLVSSRVPETSSLVAMEALACGTPVIARRIGALVDIVEHGRTGFLVDDAAEMAAAIAMVDRIDRAACRAAARRRFAARRMTDDYLALYRRVLALASAPAPASGEQPCPMPSF